MKTIEKAKALAEYNIYDIEAMAEDEAFDRAADTAEIKGYDIYFIDFGGYFGYSALVFGNGHQIRRANEYQLHHKSTPAEELRGLYTELLSGKLFTPEELKTVSDYQDFRAKREYISNLHGLREDRISMWFCGSDAERKALQEKIISMHFSSVAYAYYDDPAFVAELDGLMKNLYEAYDKRKTDFDYMKSAFLYEMYNHEYGINWQADYDVVSAFANVSGVKDCEDLGELFSAAHFTDTQQRAYMAARHEYYQRADL